MKTYLHMLGVGLLVVFFSIAAHAALENKVNGELVTLSGKVTSVAPNFFKLKVKEDTVTVEMDDFDADADGFKLVQGDDVVVSGMIDNDFLENKSIEAGSVYVKGLNTYFYASTADEEGGPYISSTYFFVPSLPENASVELQGKVTEINGREVTVDTGLRKMKVDTSSLIFNPVDDDGVTQIDKGDRIKVFGVIDNDYFEGKEVAANFVMEL